MANAALSFVVVVWISGMLFGQLIEANQLTILKGISNFFFLLYHLWYVYAFFTYAQVKYPLEFSLIMINILIFFKRSSILIKWYIYIYICRGPCSWIGTFPYTKCLGFKGENVQIAGVREKKFKLRDWQHIIIISK